MADFYSTSQTSGAGVAGDAQLAANYRKHSINQADVGRELIVSVNRSTANGAMTDAILSSVIAYITQAHGTKTGLVAATDSAFTVAAVGTADGSAFTSGTTETVYLRVQGTGQLTDADADVGIANVTVATVAVFTPAK